jgi:lipopolysaccharide transport system ATP-binding protein
MKAAITVNNLGKAYKQYTTRWARLAEWVLPGKKVRHTLKWVLQGITFTVLPGEAVGIVGINGAGKSTLLKMITGTTQPTTGRININGRVAALLELGMGFHPEFTGRQNVIMAGQLLGYTVEEITHLMSEIEAFAEIGDYIDQPVRVYSSGMLIRLAFSVATAKRPDVLIVDEALSVGDVYFQHKSFDRIRQYSKQGTTLLIVSHDKQAIQSVCNRAILLENGILAMQGEPEAVMDYYNAMMVECENQSVRQETTEHGKAQTISGNGLATVKDVVLLNDLDEQLEVVNVGQLIKLKVFVNVNFDIPELILGYMIKDHLGQPIFGTNTFHLMHKLSFLKKGDSPVFIFKFPANLGPGSYSIATALHTGDTHIENNYEWRDLSLVFKVVNVDKETFVGTAWLPPEMECVE